MPDYPIVDIHTHMFRTPEIGRQALRQFHTRHAPKIEYTGVPEDHLAGMKAAGVSYCSALAVTPTREMRERALRERGDYGTPQWESNSGLALDNKLLSRMDHNNAWACWVGQQHPELVPFIMVDPRLMSGDALASYVQNRWDEGARGVKLLGVQTHHHADDHRLFPMYEFMQSINMPLFAQSGGSGAMGLSPRTGDSWGRPMRFRETLETFPRLNVVLAHALGGYNDMMGDTYHLADRFEHVFFDMTVVLPRVAEHPELAADLSRLIIRVGAEHCAFGTNFPLHEFDGNRKNEIDIVLNLPLLSDAQKRTMLSDNGMRILHGSNPIGVGNTFPDGSPVPREFRDGGGWG
ncbi:MAG: amidohydrolase family protein [Dehalococcoidia bacterium]